MDSHRVRSDAFYLSAERDQEVRKILDVRLARGVPKHSGSRRSGSRHQRVLRRGDARLVEKDIGALEPVDAHLDHFAVREFRTELLQREEVRVESSPTNDIAA